MELCPTFSDCLSIWLVQGNLLCWGKEAQGRRRRAVVFKRTVAVSPWWMLFWRSEGREQKGTCWFSPCTNVFKRWHQPWRRGGTWLSSAFSTAPTPTRILCLMHFPGCTNNAFNVWSTQQGKSKCPWATLYVDRVFSSPLIRREQMCLFFCVCLPTPPDAQAFPKLEFRLNKVLTYSCSFPYLSLIWIE